MSFVPEGAGPAPQPSVSVVVASRNRRHMLRRFVSAVVADPATTELVVVLDGDVDGSTEELDKLRAEFPCLRPMVVEHGGHLAALQVGVEASRGDVVLLMDDDVVAGPDLVSGHARRHAGTQGLVVVGFMPVRLDEDSSSPTRLYASEYAQHCRQFESGERAVLDGLWLGNVSARRADLLRVGVASKSFGAFWHSDTDLGLRLQAAGTRGLFDRELVASHLHAQSTRSFLAAARQRGESTWLLAHEHPDRAVESRPGPVLDGLSGPLRTVVSLLGREPWAAWSSRALMGAAVAAERLKRYSVAVPLTQLARRILIVSGYRAAVRAHRGGEGLPRRHGTPGGGTSGAQQRPRPYASSSAQASR